MPIRAVRVNVATNEVDNFFNFASVTALLNANVQALPGFRWIGETDWTPDQNPANFDLWDGQIPASFGPAAPVEPSETPPATMVEAFQRIEAAQAALSAAYADAAALVPTR